MRNTGLKTNRTESQFFGLSKIRVGASVQFLAKNVVGVSVNLVQVRKRLFWKQIGKGPYHQLEKKVRLSAWYRKDFPTTSSMMKTIITVLTMMFLLQEGSEWYQWPKKETLKNFSTIFFPQILRNTIQKISGTRLQRPIPTDKETNYFYR